MNEHLHAMALAAMYEAVGRMFLDMAAVIHEQAEEAGYTLTDEPAVEPGDTKPFDARKLTECLEDEG